MANEESPDVLFGIAAIAKHIGITERQCSHLHDSGDLPTFRLGARVCARRSSLATFFAEEEAKAAALAQQTGTRRAG